MQVRILPCALGTISVKLTGTNSLRANTNVLQSTARERLGMWVNAMTGSSPHFYNHGNRM